MATTPTSLALTSIADGSSMTASPVRNNFSDVQTAVNALITILAAGTSGQVLGSSGGTTIGWQTGTVLYRKTTTKTVNTTVAATDLLNGEITVAANAMGATGGIRLTAFGDRLQFSGGTAALPRFQLLFGGTTLLDTGTPSGLETSVNLRVHWHLDAFILNTATNAQVAKVFLSITSQGGIAGGTAGFTTGLGTYQNLYTGATSVMAQAAGTGTGAVDTTVAKALVLNVINGSASATYETKLLGALVEVI